jgi:predicted phosphohydrolase
MKISLHSDIHTEFYKEGYKLDIPPEASVIVLAGDIGVGRDVVPFIQNLAYEYGGKDIIFVAGNHEYYGRDVDDLMSYYDRWFKDFPNIHYLENESVEIDDVVFHGCTLWTGFDCLGADRTAYGMKESRRNIADFYNIRYGGFTFRPEDARILHNQSKMFLKDALLEHAGKKQIIVSHFPPLKECKHGNIAPGILDTYFNNDLKELFHLVELKAWLYGHNHWCDDFTYSGCRVISNQGCYPRENERVRYDKNLIIEV